jgi:glycosyltransferase 2 family protein
MTRALRAVLVVLALGFFIAAIATEWSKLEDFDWRFAPVPFALGVLAFATMQTMHAELWRRLLSGLGHTLPPRRAWAVWNVSLLGRYVPTSVLMATGRMALAEREGVPRRVTIVSVLYEVALSLSGASLLICVWAVTAPDLPGWVRGLVWLLPVGCCVVSHPRTFHLVTDRALKRLKLEPLLVQLGAGRALALVGGYGVSFVFAGLGTYAALAALTPVGWDDAPVAIGAYAVGYWASIFGFVLPAGIGIREAGLAGALSGIVPLGVGTVGSVLVRLMQLALEAAFALASPLLARGIALRSRDETASDA